jgi:hypothetical protein
LSGLWSIWLNIRNRNEDTVAEKQKKVLDSVDSNRRGFLKRLLGVGFAAPVIASFSIESLTNTAQAQNPNQAGFDDELYLFESFFFS